MHNGLFKTLEELINFFIKGGGTDNTLLQPLNLSGAEKRALKIFMVEALSGDDINITYPGIS
jgi:cytochrome c peroxidase